MVTLSLLLTLALAADPEPSDPPAAGDGTEKAESAEPEAEAPDGAEASDEGDEAEAPEGTGAADEGAELPPPPPDAPPEKEESAKDRARAAEARRLRQELVTLARASRHDAVNRVYQQLVDIDEPIPADVHSLAADAARSRGDIMLAMARLHRAGDDEQVADITSRFGAVRFSVPAGAEFTGEEHFAPDEVTSIERTRMELGKEGRYVGMLPEGTYQVAGREVVVTPGVTTDVVVE